MSLKAQDSHHTFARSHVEPVNHNSLEMRATIEIHHSIWENTHCGCQASCKYLFHLVITDFTNSKHTGCLLKGFLNHLLLVISNVTKIVINPRFWNVLKFLSSWFFYPVLTLWLRLTLKTQKFQLSIFISYRAVSVTIICQYKWR